MWLLQLLEGQAKSSSPDRALQLVEEGRVLSGNAELDLWLGLGWVWQTPQCNRGHCKDELDRLLVELISVC